MEVTLVWASFHDCRLPFRKSRIRHPVHLVVFAVTWKQTTSLRCQPLRCQPLCSHFWFHRSMLGEKKKKEKEYRQDLYLCWIWNRWCGEKLRNLSRSILTVPIASFEMCYLAYIKLYSITLVLYHCKVHIGSLVSNIILVTKNDLFHKIVIIASLQII